MIYLSYQITKLSTILIQEKYKRTIKQIIQTHFADPLEPWQTQFFLICMHAGKKKKDSMAVLFEEWLSCGGDWSTSSFVVRMRERRKESTRGARRWMTKAHIALKYSPGRTEEEARAIAQEICDAKEACPHMRHTHIRPHPDHPLRHDMRLFLVWDEDYEFKERDTVVDNLFMAKDDGSKKKKKTDKKKSNGKKRKSTSSSKSSDEESSDSSESDSSSSSSQKNKKNKKKNAKKNKQGTRSKNKSTKPKKEQSEDDDKPEPPAPEPAGPSEKERKQQEKQQEKDRKKAEKKAEAEERKKETKAINLKKSAVRKAARSRVGGRWLPTWEFNLEQTRSR